MTMTRVCLAIGSSAHAANASVPPRTASRTSPGPLSGIGTVTRPTTPMRALDSASACMFGTLDLLATSGGNSSRRTHTPFRPHDQEGKWLLGRPLFPLDHGDVTRGRRRRAFEWRGLGRWAPWEL